MSFAMGSSSYPLHHPHFPSSISPPPCSFSSVSFCVKKNISCNVDTKRRRRAPPSVVSACMGHQEEGGEEEDSSIPKDIVFSQKRAVLIVGMSVLPFLQLRAKAVDALVTKETTLKAPEEEKKEELAIQKYTPLNPFLSLLNGLGIFGTGILGAFYALAQKEKKATDATIESMMGKLKEKEDTIESLQKNFESKLLSEQEEQMKQLRNAKDEQQILLIQLNSANGTITGLGQQLKNEKRIIEELKVQIEGLETNLLKAGEDKKAFEREQKEKLSLIEVLQDKINLLSLEIKDSEDNARNLISSLADKELELKDLNHAYEQMKDELAKACLEIQELKDELLKNDKEMAMKNSVLDELNSKISSLTVERDESIRKLNTIREEYNDLKSSSEKKAAKVAKLLGEREDELSLLKEKLDLALNEVSWNQETIADLTQEREDLKKMLDAEASNAKNLKAEMHITQETLGKSRNEASDLAEQLKLSQNWCTELQAEVSRIQAEFAEATETLQKSVDEAKQSGEVVSSELTAVKEQLKKMKEELQITSQDLAKVTENRESILKELTDAYKKAEVTADELKAEKNVVSSMNKELQSLEKQISKDKEARKSLEIDLDQATKSLDEMNRNALILSGELEMANSRISSLEDEKQVLYKSLTEQKKAVKEAGENMEDAHNMVLTLGKERESLEKKAKKLEEELASAKGEILRLRSQVNSSKTFGNEQHSQKADAEEKVTVSAKGTAGAKRTRRKKAAGSE